MYVFHIIYTYTIQMKAWFIITIIIIIVIITIIIVT